MWAALLMVLYSICLWSGRADRPFMRRDQMKAKIKLAIFVTTTALILLIVMISGCISPGCVIGSGNIKSENRTTDSFNSIELQGIGDLYVSEGQQSLRIEAEDNILPVLRSDVSGGRLIISSSTCITPRKSIKVYASSPAIRGLYLSGSGNIIGLSPIHADSLDLGMSGSGGIDMDVDCKDLRTSVSGSGNILLRGNATNSSVTISGSGNMRGYDLETSRSAVTISGSGQAEVNVRDELDAGISGSGGIRYTGSPSRINQQISGSGSLTKAG